jgi:hypothetical protein
MLIEIISVLTLHGGLILSILAIIFTGTLISMRFISSATDHSFTPLEYFSLGMSAWLIPVLLVALPASRLLQISELTFRAIAIIIFVAALFLIKPLLWRPIKTGASGWVLFLLLILSMAASLAFLSKILFPAYFDSVEHYRIIKYLIQNPGSGVENWPTPSYYHIGYHLILAAIVRLTGAGIIDVMLVSGQLVLSTLAVPLFFMISRETKSNAAALFTTSLAAFGWYMPAHAVNWGKYPALFAFSTTILVLGLIYSIFQNPRAWITIKKTTLLFIAIAACGLLHTRALVACGLFAAALFLSVKWDVLNVRWRRSILGAFLLALVGAVLYLRTDATFTTLFSSYLDNDLPTIYLVLFLTIFAIWKFPRLAFAMLLFISLACISLYIPVSGLFGYSTLYLLDRPYVQILMYIPLSFIGGLGFAGLLQVVSTWKIRSIPVRPFMQSAAFVLLMVNAIFYQKYDPASCCKLAGTDDLAAFSWIQHELPRESILMIASQNLSFTPDTTRLSTTGVDAGLWVIAMTDKVAVPYPAGTDFTQPATLEKMCNQGIDYVYLGHLAGSFNESLLIAKPDWYQVAFMLPEVKIYQVTGCPADE